MKLLIYILVVCFLLPSCDNGRQNKEITKTDTLVSKSSPIMQKDTTVTYDIEGISSEGTEAIAKYAAGKIKECVINIYGERGQIKLTYFFEPTQVKVTETEFEYKANLESVKSEKDMLLKKEIKYVTDFNGNPIGNADKNRLDIFQEVKKSVPFNL